MKFKQRNMKNILSRHKIIKLLKTSEKERLFKVVREKSYEQRNTGKDESRILVRNKASCQKKKRNNNLQRSERKNCHPRILYPTK